MSQTWIYTSVGRRPVREGERHQQGEAGSAQAQEVALTRRGRRCHERGEESCHVPDMNLQMCAHLWNLSESERNLRSVS